MDAPTTPGLTTADEIRHAMLEQFKKFEPNVQAYHEYAERVSALSLEYHQARLRETFPGVQIEEATQIAALDTRQTPKSLDAALVQLKSVPVKRIIFDRVKSVFLLLT